MAKLLTPTQREEALASRKRTDGVLGAAKDFGSGVVEGLKHDPFVAAALKHLGNAEGIDPEGFNKLREMTAGSSAQRAGQIIGEFGPTLLLAVPTGGIGGLAGRAAIQGVAKKLAMRAALDDIARVAANRAGKTGAGRLALGSGEATVGATAEKTFLKGRLGQVARKADDVIGPGQTLIKKPSIQGNPVLQRGAEGLGADLGFAGLTYTQEKARGKSDLEALQTAGIVFALAGGVDVALVGGSRLLFPGARSADLDAIRSQYIESGASRVLNKQAIKLNGRMKKIGEDLRTALNTEAQVLELNGTTFAVGTDSASRVARMRQILRPSKEALAADKNLRALSKNVDDLRRERRAIKSTVKGLRETIAFEGTLPYVGGGLSYIGPVKRIFDRFDPTGKFRFGVLTAPEAAMGTFGSVGNRVSTRLVRAVTNFEAKNRIHEIKYAGWSEELRRIVGESERQWKRGYGKNLDSIEAWETGAEAGLRDYLGKQGVSNEGIERATVIFKEREKWEWDLFQVRGREIGGKGPTDLKKQGLKKYVTHSSLDVPNEDLAAALVKSGKWTEAEAREHVRKLRSHLDLDLPGFEGVESSNPGRTGPLDFDRVKVGSLKTKIEEFGIPLNPNSWDAGLRTAQSAEKNINLHPILGGFKADGTSGVTGKTLDELVKAVSAEGFNGAKFKTMIDTIAGRTYYNEAMRKSATTMTSIQVAAKLPLAFLANASQFVLTTAYTGLRASTSGALKLTNRATREDFARALAVHEHIIRGVGRSIDDEGLVLTSFEKAADWTLRFTLFGRIERWNRVHGAASTQVALRDRLALATAGRLRGTSLDSARRMFGDLGLDLNGLTQQANRLGGLDNLLLDPAYLQAETTAVIRGAQKTQFFPGALRTPRYWSSPVGRVLFQFKTFAVGQSRFVRDAVLTEYAHGNVAPLATMLSISPVAGELVRDARSLIKDKDRAENGIMRYLDNMSAIGGMGIWTDVLGQARWGNLESVLLGPTVSDLSSLAEMLASGEADQIWNLIKRQPAYQGTQFLMGTGVSAAEYLDSLRHGGGPPVTRVDVNQKYFERARDKTTK